MTKRLFDVLSSGIGLILLIPVYLAVALAIRLDSPGSIFFRQTRVGRGGIPFRIHKFRTMRAHPAGEARQITVGRDPRITRVGYVLRKTKLDELPQLIDVFIGNMSLVGPRPEVPMYVDHYPADMKDRLLSVRPGITDASSLHFIDEADLLAQAADPERFYVEEILPIKLRHHIEYIDRRSMPGDIAIILTTVSSMFRRKKGVSRMDTPPVRGTNQTSSKSSSHRTGRSR